jgi:hypothetical protein
MYWSVRLFYMQSTLQVDLLLHHVETNVGRLCVDRREDEDAYSHQRRRDQHGQLAAKDGDSIHHRAENDSNDTRRVDGQVVAVGCSDRQPEFTVLRGENRRKIVACGNGKRGVHAGVRVKEGEACRQERNPRSHKCK